MKIKDEFALRKFADKWVAVSVNDDIDKEDFLLRSTAVEFFYGICYKMKYPTTNY